MKSGRKPAGIERPAQLNGPVLVKVVKQPGINAGPIVDGHDGLRLIRPLYSDFTILRYEECYLPMPVLENNAVTPESTEVSWMRMPSSSSAPLAPISPLDPPLRTPQTKPGPILKKQLFVLLANFTRGRATIRPTGALPNGGRTFSVPAQRLERCDDRRPLLAWAASQPTGSNGLFDRYLQGLAPSNQIACHQLAAYSDPGI